MGFETDEASSSTHVLIPGENVPFLGQNQHISSPLKTFANIFMSLVGAGVLGLRTHSREQDGRKLESQFEGAKISSFGDLGFAVCGPIGRFVVDVMIVLSQACFSVGYMIFIGNTLVYLFNSSVIETNPGILGFSPKSVYIWSCFPSRALGVVMVEDVLIYLKNRPSLEMFGGFSVFFYGLGVAVFAFEGMGMVLPLESETRDKNKFGKILGLSVAFVSFLYGAFGALGYFAFGEETKDIITTNFRQGSLSCLVQLGLCINLFLAFPLMMNPVYEILLVVEMAVVLTVCCVALTVPNFADFMSLVGSSVSVVLGFVLPAFFHLIVFKDELGWYSLALDAAFIFMGTAFAVYGTSSSLAKIFSEMA
ncbi:hypothetical protein H5410_008380 [Solanum commersonii]|uniref:Amino acid transporter transmembrane domain-containing protein n=1 Tax=Solanum commersonii TaxID=4109 RepID=A0A9J6AGE3_SOLCO|nr:hypothetical protein H5410_008380 [Solanum commersonii]